MVTTHLFSAPAAAMHTQVMAASTMNQYPNSGNTGPDGCGALPLDIINVRISNAIQNALLPGLLWTESLPEKMADSVKPTGKNASAHTVQI